MIGQTIFWTQKVWSNQCSNYAWLPGLPPFLGSLLQKELCPQHRFSTYSCIGNKFNVMLSPSWTKSEVPELPVIHWGVLHCALYSLPCVHNDIKAGYITIRCPLQCWSLATWLRGKHLIKCYRTINIQKLTLWLRRWLLVWKLSCSKPITFCSKIHFMQWWMRFACTNHCVSD